MFTGIVQNQGRIVKTQKRGSLLRLVIRLRRRERELKVGESIAVDGVCLSVAKSGKRFFEADAIPETLEATTLGSLRTGARVNLERPLRTGDRIGGHFVTGHVDGCGTIRKIATRGRNLSLQIAAPADIIRCLRPKGSIAVDGISLTIQRLTPRAFRVGIIPLTLRETTLGAKKTGDRVNLEVDLIQRYLEKLSFRLPSHGRTRKLTAAGLIRQGF